MNVENIENQSFIQLEKEGVLRAFSSEELVIELLKRNKGLELIMFEILKKRRDMK
ncbi:hypothetical protein VSU16_02940 [Cetobacterium somerae]|uniref:hypothetical protein n=1 Tax=Cetobacterium somerae TaxID=188913 RepID=UPI002E7BD18E|nr:hypothetical protein [Cetobacterium somerae]WVJ01697.1 hypothetical protein VSU16_02940 [Cetobacterium somerae]